MHMILSNIASAIDTKSHIHILDEYRTKKGVGNPPGLEIPSVNIQSVQLMFFHTRASHFLAVKEKK